MENVQLLLNEKVPTFDTMTAMTAEVSMLRNYVESYETWGVANSFSPIDEGIVTSVLASLDKLGKMCYEPPNTVLDPAMAPTTTKDGPTKEWQDLQRNMDIQSLLIRGVQIPYHTFKVHHASTGGYGESETTKTENRNKQASYDALKSVVAKSWQTSLAFLTGNKENQKIYYEFRNFMIEEMRTAPELGIATILIEVFRDNIKTIEAAEDTLFMTFAHMLGSESDPSTRLSYLTFFEVMVEVKNFGIVQASQRKAIRALVDPTFKDSILVLEPPPASADPKRRDYYLRLMKLLEACCRNRNTGATAQMQKLVPAASMLKQALDAGTLIGGGLAAGAIETKTIFTQLVTSTYFDTPLIDVSLRTEPLVWTYMVKLLELIQDIGGQDDDPRMKFVHAAVMPMISAFFSSIYQDQGFTEEIAAQKELLSMLLERICNDSMTDMSIRKFAFHQLHVCSADRYAKLDAAVMKMLSAADTTMQLGRKRSSWSMLMSGQGGNLVGKPSMYYRLFAEVAQTDHGLIEDSVGDTEMDQVKGRGRIDRASAVSGGDGSTL